MTSEVHAERDAHTHRIRSHAGALPATRPGAAAPEFLVASWRRCIEDYGLQPQQPFAAPALAGDALGQAREASQRLLRIARPEMSSLHAQIGGSHGALLLADADGVLLDRVCDPLQQDLLDRLGLAPGFLCDERHAGTAGPGTCLHEGRALTVYRDEHFFWDLAGLSCSAAPIRAPDGSMLGVLDACSVQCRDSRESQRHTTLLVGMSARLIERVYFTGSFQQHWLVRLHERAELVGTMRDGVLAIDGDCRIRGADAQAAALLGSRGAADLVGRDIGELLDIGRAGFCSRATRMPCRVWPVQGQRAGSRYFLSVRPPQRAALASAGRDDGAESAACASLRALAADAPAGEVQPAAAMDPVMAHNLWCAEQIMDKDINILLQGATGTGKGTLAKDIHLRSARRGKPFIAMCCAAIPEALAESELFGYESGAFTGARSGGMRGKIVASDGGTLFLDEIGDMPLSLQARLLHVLEEREVTPLGSTRPIPVDLHVISASNHDLPALIERGLFRQDLYYRLNGITLSLPALRERQDLRALVVEACRSEGGARPLRIEPDALACLLHYAWPGNMRELRNVVRTAHALSPDGVLRVEHLPAALRGPFGPTGATRAGLRAPSAQAALAAESGARSAQHGYHDMTALLQRHRWNISHAAADLGVSRNTLYRHMHRLGIRTTRES